MESPVNFSELNERFCVDIYLELNSEQRASFRNELKESIQLLSNCYKLKIMKKEDILSVGMAKNNRTALAITILKEKLTPYNYDQTFPFRDSIAILHTHLLEELFGGKNIFYQLSETEVGLDPNFVPFILGKKFKIGL